MSEDSRKWILEKSLELFSKKGYDGVGMAEICEETQVSKPTIYYYFQSKQGLFDAILAECGQEMVGYLKNSTKDSQDFIMNLTNLLKAQIQYAKENPEFFRLYMSLDCNAYDSDFEIFKSLSYLRYGTELVYEDVFYESAKKFGNMRGHEKLFSNIFKSIVESTTKQFLNQHFDPTEDNIYRIVKCFVYGCAN